MRFKTVRSFKTAAEKLIRKQAPEATILWVEAKRHRYVRKNRTLDAEVTGYRGIAEFYAPGFRPKRVFVNYDYAFDLDELLIK